MDSPLWIYCIGLSAQIFYLGRIFIQWYVSEKHKTVESPALFWILSTIGSMIMFLYGCLRNDFSIIFGEFITFYIYMWNIKAKGLYDKVPRFVPLVQSLIPLAALVFLMHDIPRFMAGFFQRENLPLPLILYGMTSQVVFKSRFIYQLIYSVRHNESILPLGFWIISLVGSTMIITYGAIRHDWVLILGQLGIIVFIRNIMIAHKYDKHKRRYAEETN
ncbi:MAG: lipid-A-disaccharide synthase N-terminal domain-containing protein [Spirochaetales bacterium]|nr:lipid-A-disaccharide synthase N-terminal domain-containing protein [Spirochaetales bacterium]